MKRKLTAVLLASCMAGGAMLGGALPAAGYSADDVAAKARASGWPDYLIQAGYNEWSSGSYSQDQLDQAYASVSEYNDKTGQMIANSLGVTYQGGTAQTTTEAATAAAETPAADSAETAAQAAEAPAAATVTKADGTTEERIPKSEFISMTLEEKQEYVASLDTASQEAFMNSLSTEERNSILKQLPAEEKAALIQTYVDAANNMGMNVAVDSLSGNDVSLTIRNEDGQVIGKTAIGTIIDETGIDHTLPLLGALGAAVLSLAGLGVLYRKNRME